MYLVNFVLFIFPNIEKTELLAGCRLIAQHLAHLHSVDVAAAAAEFDDDVCIDTVPLLFKRLYDWIEYCPFDSTDPQKQARYVVQSCLCNSCRCGKMTKHLAFLCFSSYMSAVVA